ncbi:MAG: hypothetical protein JWO19_4477 [Bryobacterales bacterium]|nr:hypothetical protein [Bryobacterales bacterium]
MIGAHTRGAADHAGIREPGHGWDHRITRWNVSATKALRRKEPEGRALLTITDVVETEPARQDHVRIS